jgi:hypothetical protein
MDSHLASVMRGSVGGITYLANQFHQIVARTRTAPVDPNTTAQQYMKNAVSYASVLYENLSTAQKLAWANYALTVNYSGPFGSYNVPGRQVCVGNVAVAYYLGQLGIAIGVPNATAPTNPGKVAMTSIGFSAPTSSGTGIQVDFYNAEGTEQIIGYAEISPKQNTGRLRYKGPFNSSAVGSDSPTAGASGAIEFLGLDDGGIYFARIRAITSANPFRLSAETIIRCVASTTP